MSAKVAVKLGSGVESFLGKTGLPRVSRIFRMLSLIQGTQGPAVSDMEPMESLVARVALDVFHLLRDAGTVRALTAFFRQHGIIPSTDERFDRPATQAMFKAQFSSDPLYAAGMLVAMFRVPLKQSFVADRLDKVFLQELAWALPAGFGTPKPPKQTATKIFLQQITPEIQAMAQRVWDALRVPADALNFAAQVAEDVNWHSLNIGDTRVDLPPNAPNVQGIGMELSWAIEPTAAFIVALLRLANLKAQAVKVIRQAIAEMPESYQSEGKMAHTVKKAHYDKAWNDGDPNAPRTPWGPAQHGYMLARGVWWFSTAGHGGLMVAAGVAAKKLSGAARREGEHFNGSFWYEEDVGYAVAFYENMEWAEIMHRKGGGSTITKASLERILHSYYPQYLKRVEQGYQAPSAPKAGEKYELTKELEFRSGTVLPVGTRLVVEQVRRSSIIFFVSGGPSRQRFRLTLGDVHEGVVVKVGHTQEKAVMSDKILYRSLQKLARTESTLRKHIVPLLRKHADCLMAEDGDELQGGRTWGNPDPKAKPDDSAPYNSHPDSPPAGADRSPQRKEYNDWFRKHVCPEHKTNCGL